MLLQAQKCIASDQMTRPSDVAGTAYTWCIELCCHFGVGAVAVNQWELTVTGCTMGSSICIVRAVWQALLAAMLCRPFNL